MHLQFSGTHFLNDKTFRAIVNNVNTYNPDTGADALVNEYISFGGEKANWESLGKLDNVWVLDSGFGKTEQDRDFVEALDTFARRNGLNREDFHQYSPKRFSGSNNAISTRGDILPDESWKMVKGKLVSTTPAAPTAQQFLTLDEVADAMRPLYDPKGSRGYTGSVWAVVNQLRARLTQQ